MAHQHKYDKNVKQLCCTQQEKIYTNAGAKHLLKEGHTEHDGHDHDHEEGDCGHKEKEEKGEDDEGEEDED